jgi:hypothetical protein
MQIATIDDKRRVRIPDAKPGQAVSIEPGPNGGWTFWPVRTEAREKSPRGSLLKYMTRERDNQQEEIYKACVKGPQ